jgi:hypothetical protein
LNSTDIIQINGTTSRLLINGNKGIGIRFSGSSHDKLVITDNDMGGGNINIGAGSATTTNSIISGNIVADITSDAKGDLQNTIISNNKGSGDILFDFSHESTVYEFSDNVISNNIFTGAIQITGREVSVIERNTISNNRVDQIGFLRATGGTDNMQITNLAISGNLLTNVTDGIIIGTSAEDGVTYDDVRISDNTLGRLNMYIGNDGAGLETSSRIVIEGNTLTTGSSANLLLNFTHISDIMISNNMVVGEIAFVVTTIGATVLINRAQICNNRASAVNIYCPTSNTLTLGELLISNNLTVGDIRTLGGLGGIMNFDHWLVHGNLASGTRSIVLDPGNGTRTFDTLLVTDNVHYTTITATTWTNASTAGGAAYNVTV